MQLIRLMCIVICCCFYLLNSGYQAIAQINNNEFDISTDSEETIVANKNSELLSRYAVDEELIFTIKIDSNNVGEVFAIVQEEGLFFELDSLVSTLEFPIQANQVNSRYSGWFIRENMLFELNIGDNDEEVKLVANNTTYPINNAKLRVIQGVPYFSESLLNEVFSIGVSFKLTDQALIFTPRIRLPLQERLDRKNREVNERRQENIAKYPELFRGYEIFSPQVLDLSARINYSENSDDVTGNYSVLGRREIAYVNARTFFSGSDNEFLTNARLNFSKLAINSPAMDLLGLTKIEFGDVTPISVGNSSSGGQAVGLVFTNNERRRSNNQQNISIIGEVLQGWDVELYRNNILVGQRLDIQDGRYEFNDVQLFVGENQFEVVSYGPQGEINKESISRYLTAVDNTKDKWKYTASITKPNSSLLGIDNFADDPNSNDLDLAVSLQKSILPGTSLSFGMSNQLNGSNVNNTFSTGISGRITDRILYSTNFSDNKTSQTVNIGFRTSFWGHAANISFANTKTKATSENESRNSQYLSLDNRGSFSLFERSRLSYENNIVVSQSDISSQLRASNSVGIKSSLGGFYHELQHRQLSVQDNTGLTTKESFTGGSLSYRNRFWRIQTRLNASYGIDGDNVNKGINAYALDLSYTINNKLSTSYNIAYQKTRDALFQNLNLIWSMKNTTLSATISHSDIIGLNAGLNARLSMGGEPINTDLFYNSQGLTNSGTLVVRVFKDTNLNAKYDVGEELIENATIESKQSRALAISNADGIGILQNLSTSQPTDIVIDGSKTDNPFITSLVEGVSVQPRSGFVDRLDYPMVETSELEGNIVVEGQDPIKGAYITLQLVNVKSKATYTTRSEFDGYFFFENIKPGRYTLTISDDELGRRRLSSSQTHTINFDGLSDIYIIDKFLLQPIPYESTFLVKIAEFSNMKMLSGYVSFLKAKLNRQEIFKWSYLQDHASDKFLLVSQALPSQLIAATECKQYKRLGLNCEVIKKEFPTHQLKFGTKFASTTLER